MSGAPVYDEEAGGMIEPYRTTRITVTGPASFLGWWDWRHSRANTSRPDPNFCGGYQRVGGERARTLLGAGPHDEDIPF